MIVEVKARPEQFSSLSDLKQRALPILSLTTSTQISERHHTDPPKLWVGVTIASILIHVFGFGMLYWLMVRQQTSAGTQPIAVDIVAVAPKDSQVTSRDGNRKYVSPQPSGLTSNSKIRQNSPSAPQRAASPPQTSQPATTQQAARSPSRVSSPNRQQDKKQSSRILSQGTGNQARKETQNRNLDRREKSDTQTSPSSNGTGGNSADKPSKNNSKRLPIKKPVPQTAPSSGNNNPPPSQPSSQQGQPPSEKPQPDNSGGLVASLSNEHLPVGSRDLPDSPAKPLNNQQEIDVIHYASPALKNLKQVLSVRVRLVIDKTGKVESTKVLKSSGDKTVDLLAEDMLKNWSFKPAIQGGQPVYGNLELELQIAPRRR